MSQSFVDGAIATPFAQVARASATLTWRDRAGGARVRWGIDRYGYLVDPGLYAVGDPDDESDVLVTANYKLTFDAVREHLAGRSLWVLVLDTQGINVWCAAGKRTFGTDEVVARIASSDLAQHVSHDRIILPQLGAPGVDAAEVRRRSGFKVTWAPVRASDLPAFLDAGYRAEPEQRRVAFTLRDRLVLTPLEFLGGLPVTLVFLAAMVLLGGFGPGGFSWESVGERAPLGIAAALLGLLSGAVLTPVFLPRLEWRMYAAKGFEVGLIVSLIVLMVLSFGPGFPVGYVDFASAAALVIAGGSYFAMLFTGSTPYTSVHGAQLEMKTWLPRQIALAALALVLRLIAGWF